MGRHRRKRTKKVHPEGCACCIWIKSIQVGDVLEAPSGKLRVVRYVDHCGASVPKTWVGMTIGRQSWTGRPYTVMNGNDLRTVGYRPTGARFETNDRFQKLFLADMKAPRARDCTFTPSDVAGIP